ncbi:MAG TPA: hypothetical protein VLB76_26000 [Thermoanaerobaculia bacterium]|nr:hypothetical protein [Thermoanaerobaculia bacterium]
MQLASYNSLTFRSCRRKLAPLIFLVAWLAGGGAGLCQSPAGPPLRAWHKPIGPQYPSGVVVRPDGGTAVSWIEFPFPDQQGPYKELIRSFSLADAPLSDPVTVLRVPNGARAYPGPMAVNASGNLVVSFSTWRPTVRRYGFSQGPQRLGLDSFPGSSTRVARGIAIDARGAFVAVWESQDQESTDQGSHGWGVFGRLVATQGFPVGPEIHVNTVRQGDQISPKVSMAAETGAFVAVWETHPASNNAQVAGQLFTPGGARKGSEFRVGSVVGGSWNSHPVVAMAPEGSFVVVWQEPDPDDGGTYLILGRRFSPEGAPLGSTFRISEGFSGTQQFPAVASDPHGNFVVTWNEDELLGVTVARLYKADGTPVGAPVALTKGVGQENGLVAFGWNGTFALVWQEGFLVPIVHVRRFSASPGEEVCFFRNTTPVREAELECDTGRTGDQPEVRHPFGGKAGDVGLLGDIDGDGRSDPCVFRSGVFLCDTEHDSGTTGVTVGFGQAGDLPFLADVDGDRRADPCVYRSGHFLCDTAHDGGGPEVDLAFGIPGDVPLLGDLDGDGRADPCVVRAGHFLCDTHHDGAGNVDIAFGEAGDPALLGDFDGDGRADPCVYVQGILSCDTAHDGGSPEGHLHLGFGDRDSVPMLGNLDGL